MHLFKKKQERLAVRRFMGRQLCGDSIAEESAIWRPSRTCVERRVLSWLPVLPGFDTLL